MRGPAALPAGCRGPRWGPGRASSPGAALAARRPPLASLSDPQRAPAAPASRERERPENPAARPETSQERQRPEETALPRRAARAAFRERGRRAFRERAPLVLPARALHSPDCWSLLAGRCSWAVVL